jgi:hypothetical protein
LNREVTLLDYQARPGRIHERSFCDDLILRSQELQEQSHASAAKGNRSTAPHQRPRRRIEHKRPELEPLGRHAARLPEFGAFRNFSAADSGLRLAKRATLARSYILQGKHPWLPQTRSSGHRAIWFNLAKQPVWSGQARAIEQIKALTMSQGSVQRRSAQKRFGLAL